MQLLSKKKEMLSPRATHAIQTAIEHGIYSTNFNFKVVKKLPLFKFNVGFVWFFVCLFFKELTFNIRIFLDVTTQLKFYLPKSLEQMGLFFISY